MNESAQNGDRFGTDRPAMTATFRLPTGHEAIVVIDDTTLGPAIGGVRMSPAVTAVEVARLARAMTIKNAAAGLPYGGAKSGIVADRHPIWEVREIVVRAFARAIQPLVEYIPGPDMGTDETTMAWIHDEIGRAVGLPSVLGGIPLDELGATGHGLAVCAQALKRHGLLELEGAQVVIQGFGSVGRHAARELESLGAKVIAVSDSGGATWNPDGLDIADLLRVERPRSVGTYANGKKLPRDDILYLDCDILIPAARPDVLDAGNADRIAARVVLEGANIPSTPEADAILGRRGVLVIPDVIANAGGVICAAVEHRGGSRSQAFEQIAEKIDANVDELLGRMATSGLDPRAAANAMALDRLHEANRYRRKF